MGKTRKEAQKEITLVQPSRVDHLRCVDLRNANARFFFSPARITLASHRKWYKRLAGDPSRAFYVVKLDTDVIGTIGLSRIDYHHKHAEYGQFVIGQEWSGNGYGRRALCALLWKAFGERGLHRVYGDILAGNERGIQTAHSVGFVVEGHFKDHIRQAAEFVDVVRVAILKDDFDGIS